MFGDPFFSEEKMKNFMGEDNYEKFKPIVEPFIKKSKVFAAKQQISASEKLKVAKEALTKLEFSDFQSFVNSVDSLISEADVKNTFLSRLTPSGNPYKNSLMVDIETGGLAVDSPIIQFGSFDIDKDIAREQHLFPVSFTRDTPSPFKERLKRNIQKDAEAKGIKLTDEELEKLGAKATYDFDAKLYTSKEAFLEEQGEWAFRGAKGQAFGLNELFDSIKGLDEEEIFRRLRQDRAIWAGGKEFINPRELAIQTILDLKDLQERGGNLIAHNIKFESRRMGGLISAFLQDEQTENLKKLGGHIGSDSRIVAAFGKEITEQDYRDLFEAAAKPNIEKGGGPPKSGVKNIWDETNLLFQKTYEKLISEGKDDQLFSLYRLYKETNVENTVRTLDTQTMIRMMFSGMAQTGLTESSKDLYSMTSVDVATRIMYGTKEAHTALSDVMDQTKILNTMGRALDFLGGISSDGSIKGEVKSFLTATAAMASEEFQSAFKLANSRFAKLDFEFNGRRYQGTALELLKKESVDRSLTIMRGSIEAVLSEGDGDELFGGKKIYDDTGAVIGIESTGKNELFTVSEPGGKSRKYQINDPKLREVLGDEVTLFKQFSTDNETMLKAYQDWVRMGKTPEAKEKVTRDLLKRYSKSAAIRNTNISLDDLEASYKSIESEDLTSLVDRFLVEGNEGLKGKITDEAVKAQDMASYKDWYLNKYSRHLKVAGVAAVAAAGVGYGFVSNWLESKEAKQSSKIGDFTRSGPATRKIKNQEDFEKYQEYDPLAAAAALMNPEVQEASRSRSFSLAEYVDKFSDEKLRKFRKYDPDFMASSNPQPAQNLNLQQYEGINKNFEGRAAMVSISRDATVEVEDPDTVKITQGTNTFNIRMEGIDSPEVKHGGQAAQVGAQEAKIKAEALIKNAISTGNVKLMLNSDQETYGRQVGTLFLGNENINLQLVEKGLAAALPFGEQKESLNNFSAYSKAENKAYESKTGIWKYRAYEMYKQSRPTAKNRFTFNQLASRQNSYNLDMMALSLNMQDVGSDARLDTGMNVVDRGLNYRLPEPMDYDDIVGLQENGLARYLRREHTDFGSPYRGPKSSLNAIKRLRELNKKNLDLSKDSKNVKNIISSRKPVDTDRKIKMAQQQNLAMMRSMRRNAGRGHVRNQNSTW